MNFRFVVDLLEAEHVLVGSDWPIMPIASRHYVGEVLGYHRDMPEEHSSIGATSTKVKEMVAQRAHP